MYAEADDDRFVLTGTVPGQSPRSSFDSALLPWFAHVGLLGAGAFPELMTF